MNKIIVGAILIILTILFIGIFSSKIEFLESYKTNIGENTIWCYWDQGIENIYPFYKLCIKTWKKNNPSHNIIIVDKNTIYDYVNKQDLPPNWEKIKLPQLKSDFVRLALLTAYGGIWMDISTICIKPINSVFKQKRSLEGFAIRKFDNNSGLSVLKIGL